MLTAGILGGTLASSSHFAKAGSRALINTSPEPFSNWAASFSEDALVGTVMWLAFTHAWLLIGVLAVLVVLSLLLIRSLWRFLAGMFRKLSLPAFNPPHFSP